MKLVLFNDYRLGVTQTGPGDKETYRSPTGKIFGGWTLSFVGGQEGRG